MIIMPSPRRTVTRGLAVCLSMGLNRVQGLELIRFCAISAMIDSKRAGASNVTWLLDVIDEVKARQAGRR